MSIRQSLANSLQMHRISQGQSIESFAEQLSISRSTLQSYLKGAANPTIDTIELIAERLNVSSATLLYEGNHAVFFMTGLIREVAALSPEKQLLFAEYLRQIIELWD